MTVTRTDANVTLETNAAHGMSGAAMTLAYAGALPVIVGALASVIGPGETAGKAASFMALYGGLLIAFFGGVRWGVAVMKPGGPTFRSLLGGAIPLALALPVFYPGPATLKLGYIAAVLVALLVDDLRATRSGEGAPDWYLGVRAPLTALLVFAYVIALVRVV